MGNLQIKRGLNKYFKTKYNKFKIIIIIKFLNKIIGKFFERKI